MPSKSTRSHPLLSVRTAALLLACLIAMPAAAQERDPYAVEGTEPNRGGTIDRTAEDPAVALSRLHVADGYEITLFASEKEFPLGNPVALAFDAKGRLWVSTMPSYPHRLPDEAPNDKILILEDTNGDGRADTHTVFADSLYLPLGFELGDGGVYVSQQPNLVFLRDVDGDDVADERTVLLHGFGTEDSHHSLSAFTWGPGGALYFQEGTFHHSQVETPHGVVRLRDAGVFRFEPWRHHLEVFVSYYFANPWGHVFDRWGNSFIADASGGHNYFGNALSGYVEYPRKHPPMRPFTAIVRPTSGVELVRSRHFPAEAQGVFLVTNVIGFQGIKQHRIIEEGSGFTAEELEPLLWSSDLNFRPVDVQFGPDGALYVVDWFNPLIGHMQYSMRDPDRDRSHGRIWRITYTGRDLLDPPEIDGADLAALLDLLTAYEDRTRYRARRELRQRDPAAVLTALEEWVAGLESASPDHEHHLLEALWMYQSLDRVEPGLLRRLLEAEDHRARAAAVRVLLTWRDRIDDTLAQLERAVNDPEPRVRLEALVALSFMPEARAAELALEAVRHPMDYYLTYVLEETLVTLEPHWHEELAFGAAFAADNPEGLRHILGTVETAHLAQLAGTEPVYREMLRRAGVDDRDRLAAADALAQMYGVTRVDALIGVVQELDAEGAVESIDDLQRLLVREDVSALQPYGEVFAGLAERAIFADVRRLALAALVHADGSVERAWELASASLRGLYDLVRAVPGFADTSLAHDVYPRLVRLVRELPASLEDARASGTSGRTVRIALPFRNVTLSLAEVEVLGPDGTNYALEGTARQSTSVPGGDDWWARLAVDGITDGDPAAGSLTRTQSQHEPWWEVDLGAEREIEKVVVWNRTDGEAARLNGYVLTVRDDEGALVFRRPNLPAPMPGDTIQVSEAISAAELQRAAIRVLPAVPDRSDETLSLLSDLLEDGLHVGAVVESIRRLDRRAWGASEARTLSGHVLAVAGETPPENRDQPSFEALVAFGRDVIDALPEPERSARLGELEVLVPMMIEIRAIRAEMRFDVASFEVAAGRPVLLLLVNDDDMPHNLLVTAPGALEEVGLLGDAMAASPDGFEKQFVPDTPKVLWATDLIGNGERTRLVFTAPEDPGDYPFVCTFPGHWRTMNGVMRVVSAAD